MIIAIIPAAGKSTRMGRPKLSLPLGDRTVLERVIDTLLEGGIRKIVVVVGPHTPELARLAKKTDAVVHQLAEQTPDMRATVEAGLRWVAPFLDIKDEDQWLLCPADHPCLDARVIEELRKACVLHPESTIFIPTYQGQRGHPALIAWKHVAGIRTLPRGEGLNAYLRQHSDETREVPLDLEGVVIDLDTPEDYERVARRVTAPDG
jgi:molybdenum cofactor cytidylyltransferase